MISDELIASYLDDEWRTVPSVRRLVSGCMGKQSSDKLCDALRRLALAGKIEKQEKPTDIPRKRSGVFKIEFYRKLA